jgi:hypothetical protein
VKATLIFSEARTLKFLNRFLKKGFGHVRVVVHLEYVNIIIDPRIAYTSVECYARGDILVPNAGETHVKIRRLLDINKIRRNFGPLNCVEAVKSFIGCSNHRVITPYQLYKEALKNG